MIALHVDKHNLNKRIKVWEISWTVPRTVEDVEGEQNLKTAGDRQRTLDAAV